METAAVPPFSEVPTAPPSPSRRFDGLVRHLQAELERRASRNPRYSLRAFARALELDGSTLSKILRGRRPLGRRAAYRLGARLGLNPQQIDNL